MRTRHRSHKSYRPVIDLLEDRHLLSHTAEPVVAPPREPAPAAIDRADLTSTDPRPLSASAVAKVDVDPPDKDDHPGEEAARADELAAVARTAQPRSGFEAVPLYVPPQRGVPAAASDLRAAPGSAPSSIPVSMASPTLVAEPQVGSLWVKLTSSSSTPVRAGIAPGPEPERGPVRLPAIKGLGKVARAGAALAGSMLSPGQQVLLPYAAGLIAEAVPSAPLALNDAIDQLLESFTNQESESPEGSQGVSVLLTMAVVTLALELGRRRLRQRSCRGQNLIIFRDDADESFPESLRRWPGSWSASLR